jgi:hypothetical protein
VARVVVHDLAQNLYDVEVPTGRLTPLAVTDVTLSDLALAPDGRFFGASFGTLVEIVPSTGATREIGVVDTFLNALDFAPDGQLYGAGGELVYVLDPVAGTARNVAGLPGGLRSAGDLAFIGERMYVAAVATVDSTTPCVLVEVTRATGATRIVGSMGQPCVWGLAAFGDTLYGFTCRGDVLRVDPATARSVRIGRTDVEFAGAAAR